jgi:hypothetical protein
MRFWFNKSTEVLLYAECPYDELAARRISLTPYDWLSLPARLLLAEGYKRTRPGPADLKEWANQACETAMELACGERL